MDGSEAWEARLASRRRWRGWLVGGAVRLVLVAACIDAAQASPRIHSRIHDDGGGSRALLNERGHLANAALLTHPDPCAGSVINAQPDACAYVRTHCAVEPGESLVDYRVIAPLCGPFEIHLIRGGHVPRRRARLLDPRGHRGGLLLPGGQDSRGSMEPSASHRRRHAPRAGQRSPRRLRIPRSLLKVQRKRWIYKSWILIRWRRRLDGG